MKMIKAETIYKTTDGCAFKSLEEAEYWQYVLDIGAKLYADPDYFHGAINVSTVIELKRFLKRNADWIKPLMGWK
jgi:hypothetical protein